MMRKLTEEECRFAMAEGEFSPVLIGSAPAVAVILTQSWCPQWAAMYGYLPALEKKASRGRIFYTEYDREPWFDDFMAFKEDIFGNREIPYVRYYRGGQYLRDSNYIAFEGFLSRWGIE
jgi:hypothetical protein